MISESPLVTIVNPIRVDDHTFLQQEQYCYVRTEVVSPFVTRIVGIASWCFYTSGSICEGIVIDGVSHSFHINFGTAPNHRYDLFLAFLNALGVGTFEYYEHEPPLVERSICIRVLCGPDNGDAYDLLWTSFNEIQTIKSTCPIQEKNCCAAGTFLVVKFNDVEYLIPEDDGVITYECNADVPTFEESFNNIRLMDTTIDYDKAPIKRMKPNICKILAHANNNPM